MSNQITIEPNVLTGIFPESPLIVTEINNTVIFDLRNADWRYLTIQMIKDGAADITSLVLKIQKSIAGRSPQDFSSPVTLSVEGMTAQMTVISLSYIHATITTAGTSGTIRLYARASKQIIE